MRVKDVCKIIDKFAPILSSQEYDNSGLQIGRYDAKVKGVVISLDLTLQVIEYAVEQGCNLIITHHPILFEKISKMDMSMPIPIIINKAINNEINVYASHTCFDSAEGGIADSILKMAGCTTIYPYNAEKLGRMGVLDTPISLDEMTKRFSMILDDKHIKTVVGKTLIKTIAFSNGAGGRDMKDILLAFNRGADVYISSEFKYSNVLIAKEMGMSIIEVGHYNSEIIFVDIVASLLEDEDGLKCYPYRGSQDPYQ